LEAIKASFFIYMSKTTPTEQVLINHRKAVRRDFFKRQGQAIKILSKFMPVAMIKNALRSRKTRPERDSITKGESDYLTIENRGRYTDGSFSPRLPGDTRPGHVMCNVQVQSDDEATQKSITTKGLKYLPSY